MGRTIRLYLVDGSATGLLTAEIINWTGKILVGPRSRLADLGKRDESRRTGVYFLIGPDPEAPGRECVYIGEGDRVLTRLVGHDKDERKDFWTNTIVVVSKDENLTKSHGRYLESRLIELAKQSGRAGVVNGTAPLPPPLPEPDVADMESFLDHIRLILPAIGHSFLQPKPDTTRPSGRTTESPLFVISKVGARAEAREIDGEFVVLQGSTARREGVESWTSYRSQRDQLVHEGKLIPHPTNPDLYQFAESVAFASPSAASSVVMARNTNGRIEWRSESTGHNYHEWQDAQLRGAGLDTASEEE